jgi:hypothetical protein
MISFVGISLNFLSACNQNSAKTNKVNELNGLVSDSLNDEPKGNGNTYKLLVNIKPDVMESGKKVLFSFTPQIVGKETEPVPLDNQRGHEMQMIIVNDELNWFDHRYPGLSDLGTYEQTYTFDKGGIYHMYIDYKPTGSNETYHKRSFAVNGFSSHPANYTEPKLTSTIDEFEITITPGQESKFESGKMQELDASITKSGVVIDPNILGDYLQGKGHMVIIGVKDKDYQHIYPKVENGKLVFQAYFLNPGFYRAWLQFQTENITHTADFILKVEASSTDN